MTWKMRDFTLKNGALGQVPMEPGNILVFGESKEYDTSSKQQS